MEKKIDTKCPRGSKSAKILFFEYLIQFIKPNLQNTFHALQKTRNNDQKERGESFKWFNWKYSWWIAIQIETPNDLPIAPMYNSSVLEFNLGQFCTPDF